MTDRPTKTIVNCSTGQQTVEFLTDEEIAERDRMHQEWLVREAEMKAAADAKAAAKASGIAKLLALGLTEEEANALVK